ncbi:MAG: YdeI/OmpD-associated family protein [Myxococcales bacterium]|nr:YdeI/OmpD-associated family protein [Myxococcales bacterium]
MAAQKSKPAAHKSPAQKPRAASEAEPQLSFEGLEGWLKWLKQNHAKSGPVWLRLAKKGAAPSITYSEAIEGALIWGWIDSQKAALDDTAWLQRFSRRTPKSPWSKINREKAEALIAAKRLAAPGSAAVEQAKADGRWERAYPGARTIEVPEDFARALAKAPKAKRFFEALDAANRFAILYRLHSLKTAKGRENALVRFVEMCSRGETIHPTRAKPRRNAKAKPTER